MVGLCTADPDGCAATVGATGEVKATLFTGLNPSGSCTNAPSTGVEGGALLIKVG